MNQRQTAASQPPASRCNSTSRLQTGLAATAIVLAAMGAYWNSFQGAFVFDDFGSIVENATIRHLWPAWDLLLPPLPGATVEGRPLLNLSLALNYAISGLDARTYHAANLALHILAGLTLFGIVRRTLTLPAFRERMGSGSTGIGAATALLWLVHPLQTESVTYLVQRAESLAGLLYLLTLYLSLRGFPASRPWCWYVAAVVLCLMGMAAKEVMVSAPIMVLLYDRLFVAGSLREAFRKRRGLYSALFLTWGLLAALVAHTGNRGRGAGFGLGRSSWEYLATQFGAIVHYLRLCLWPHPLILDYGWDVARSPWQILPAAALVGGLLIATVAALRFRPWVGFLGVWFFALLAPSSSIVPLVAQTIAEHRMYLPLAAVVTGAVITGYLGWMRLRARTGTIGWLRILQSWVSPAALVGLLVVVFGSLTASRNRDYRSSETIWRDTLSKRPQNPRAYTNLGHTLAMAGRMEEAIELYRQALRSHPYFDEAHLNLGFALASRGKVIEAIEHYERALKIRPDWAEAHHQLGNARMLRRQTSEAIASYRQALEFEPALVEAHNNLGLALAAGGRFAEAIEHYRTAVSIKPGMAEAHNNLGDALHKQGRLEEAIEEFRRALQLQPDSPAIRENLARVLKRQRKNP